MRSPIHKFCIRKRDDEAIDFIIDGFVVSRSSNTSEHKSLKSLFISVAEAIDSEVEDDS